MFEFEEKQMYSKKKEKGGRRDDRKEGMVNGEEICMFVCTWVYKLQVHMFALELVHFNVDIGYLIFVEQVCEYEEQYAEGHEQRSNARVRDHDHRYLHRKCKITKRGKKGGEERGREMEGVKWGNGEEEREGRWGEGLKEKRRRGVNW